MIELVFFLHYIVNLRLEHINTNLYLEKACHLNATISPYAPCDDKGVNQVFISEVKDYSYLLTLCTSTLFIMLATSWSDLSGKRRRPLIILSISSQILQSINALAHYFFWSWSPLAAIIINMLLESIGGMNMMFFMALIYICDMSAAENRTMRLGLLWAIRTLCLLLSQQVLAAVSPSVRSFLPLYSVCLSLSIISLLLALCLVKDISVGSASDTEQSFVFDVKKIFQSFEVVFEKSLGKKRQLVLSLLAAYVAVYFTIEGENSVFDEFLRYRTDSTTISYLHSFRHFADIFGTLFCSFILSKLFRIRDVSIGIFAGVCNIIGVISYLIADVEWGLYAATISYGFSGAILSVSVSSLSKFYESGKLGRLIGVLNLFWLAVIPSRWIYYKVFATISGIYLPVFFLISLLLNIAALCLYCISLKFWRLASAPL